ncbi:hypothetical protein QMO56_09955 [Roseomonas sp. E05]|uniref:hypothetical protein n=1 Tax=Roseomonas sp. E05 TaxID=3046310 RepID=UPI0024B95BB7|nr:hypothetical protein [Roseomonas sp. E05]MDJ0388438.1 hypothetical protein [Roseomonas sp. E05]
MNRMPRTPHEAPPPTPMEMLGPWWRFSAESLKDGGDGPMRPLWQAGLSAQRIYSETLTQEIRLLMETQARLGQCLQDLAASRRPQDWMTAQAALMATAFEATSSQARMLQRMADDMRSCCQQVTSATADAAATAEAKPVPTTLEAKQA